VYVFHVCTGNFVQFQFSTGGPFAAICAIRLSEVTFTGKDDCTKYETSDTQTGKVKTLHTRQHTSQPTHHTPMHKQKSRKREEVERERKYSGETH